MQREVEANPSLKGLVMGQHGLINWADDDKECYELTLGLIDKAADYIESKDKGDTNLWRPEILRRWTTKRAMSCWRNCCRGCEARFPR